MNLAFSHVQMVRVQSGAPPCAMSSFESGENATDTNSFACESVEVSRRRRFREWRSKMVMTPLSAFSATATNFLLGETAMAVISSVLSVPGRKRWMRCSKLKMHVLCPAG